MVRASWSRSISGSGIRSPITSWRHSRLWRSSLASVILQKHTMSHNEHSAMTPSRSSKFGDRRRKVTDKQLEAIQKLSKQGLSKRAISSKLKLKYYTVLYHASPELYHQSRREAGRRWIEKNIEQVRKTRLKASKRYLERLKKEGGERWLKRQQKVAERARANYYKLKADPARYAVYLKKKRIYQTKKRHGQVTKG